MNEYMDIKIEFNANRISEGTCATLCARSAAQLLHVDCVVMNEEDGALILRCYHEIPGVLLNLADTILIHAKMLANAGARINAGGLKITVGA